MKIITFVFLTLVVLSIGCFDGDRGILTELLVEPAAAPPVQVREPLTAEIAVGTGSELVMSPVPMEIEDALWRSWDASLDYLEWLLSLRHGKHLNADGELVPNEVKPHDKQDGAVASAFSFFCENVHRRLFYDKYINAGGIAIIAPSERTSPAGVDDEFLYAAREIILTMTSKRPELREVLSPAHKFRYVLVGFLSHAVNLPDELQLFAQYPGFWGGNLAAGGIYWHLNDKKAGLSSGIVVHEMAHAIDYAFGQHPHLFPDWGTRLKTAYTLAYQKALQGKGFFDDPDLYALTNTGEYWATGAQEWFTDIHGNNLADEWQRAKLIEQDPLLYALLDEVFPAVDLPVHIEIAE